MATTAAAAARTVASAGPGEPVAVQARAASATLATSAAEFDAFLAVCPSRQLLARISDKWVTLVLCALGGAEGGTDGGAGGPAGTVDAAEEAGGGLRYSQLSRQLVGVSQKMLTQTLRALEGDGVLTRTVVATVPVTVTYELTELGRSLLEAVAPLKAWAEEHMGEVLEHRAVAAASAVDGFAAAEGPS